MRKIFLLVMGVLLFAACSTPKYAYYFDYHDYNSGRKKANVQETITTAQLVTPETSPLQIDEQAIIASADKRIVKVDLANANMEMQKKAFAKKYAALSKTEKKEFRKELKTELKRIIKAKNSGDEGKIAAATKVMDYNLKMAIIFGAVGVVLSLLGGVNSVFWILSIIAIVIGVVFLIKWLAEQ